MSSNLAESPRVSALCDNIEAVGGSVMDMQPDSERIFGPFRLLVDQRLLLRGNERIRIGSRAIEILIALVENAGKIVSKSDLMARVWPKAVVEEGTLRVHVAVLRKLLGGGRNDLRYIENVMGHGYRFVAPVARPSQRPEVAADAGQTNSLPVPLTGAIGRARTVCMLTVQLAHQRLVTLVGPGGVGKTTVALVAAHQLRTDYAGGVHFVDLASIPAAALLPSTLAGIEERLQHEQALLVLDNCEHIIEAAAAFAEGLLRRLPGLQILATSREPLRAAGESVLRVAPLEFPPPGGLFTAAEALRFPAIQLFCERATSCQHTFELRDADVPLVTEICRRLDGLPLAIELAAARVGLLSIRGLRACLDDRLGLLSKGHRTAPVRHRSLQANFDWSYSTLTPSEQLALARLAVLEGKFEVGTATEVVSLPNPLGLLADLVAKSFFHVHTDGDRVLYEMLATVRGFASEKHDPERDDLTRDTQPVACQVSDRLVERWQIRGLPSQSPP